MTKNVLIVHAHPEPLSLTRALVRVSADALRGAGHTVVESDLHALGWKAVFDAADFPARADSWRLAFVAESAHAYASGQQSEDVAAEQRKLLAADALILQFPLWWFGMPAILKGWIDRVWAYGLAYGYRDAGNRYRYGEGAFRGKRALLCVTVGGPQADYGPRGINGTLDELLFPITHGMLFFPGMHVLPTHAVYAADRLDQAAAATAFAMWRKRVLGLFEDAPIPFRAQNGGDNPDGHTLADAVAVGVSGFAAHVAAAGDAAPLGDVASLGGAAS